jgi:hypothetical protein
MFATDERSSFLLEKCKKNYEILLKFSAEEIFDGHTSLPVESRTDRVSDCLRVERGRGERRERKR